MSKCTLKIIRTVHNSVALLMSHKPTVQLIVFRFCTFSCLHRNLINQGNFTIILLDAGYRVGWVGVGEGPCDSSSGNSF